MGGRGNKSGLASGAQILTPQPTATQQQAQVRQNAQQMQPPQPQPQPQPDPIVDQTPDDNNTPVTADVLDQLKNMTDAQLAQAYRASQHASLPNHLDDASDITQKFVFHIGLNDKPMVLDSSSFRQFMQANGIPQSEVLSRSVNGGTLKTSAGGQRKLTAQDVIDMMTQSRLNYIGGKHGGQALGAGTYFDMNGGSNTGYGGTTVNAVLNPKTAKVISESSLARLAHAYDRSHPQFARATGGYNPAYHGGNESVYALVLGYNVITGMGSYYNVIDRKALVYRK